MCGATSVAAQHTAATVRCRTNQLTIAADYGEGGVGHLGLIFLVHNLSGQACTLYGYPGAQLLNGSQHSLPTHLKWGEGYLVGALPKRTVVLPPGIDAYFSLEWVHIPSPGQSCPVAPFLRITPPNTTVSLIVWSGPGGIMACGGNLTASPVESSQFAFGAVPVA